MARKYAKKTICQICGKPIDGHVKCERCAILIGEGHADESTTKVNGKTVCSMCALFPECED